MLGKIFRRRLLTHTVLVGALGVAVLATCAGQNARAAEDDDDNSSSIFSDILKGIGLRRDGPNIDYRERSPLVVPPNRTMPSPEASAAVNNPAWPIDPDVKQRKAAKEAEDKTPRQGDSVMEAGRPLRPDELRRGTRPRGADRKDGLGTTIGNDGRPERPSALGYMGGLFGSMFNRAKDDTAKFTGEPPRSSLIEPPVGYQTPSPDYPYGLTTKQTPKAADVKERATPVR